MAVPYLKELPPYNKIGMIEEAFVMSAMKKPLSGYIGGNPKGGRWVEHLSGDWEAAFGTKYAIPCNSATSGLLAACMAVGIKPGDHVWTTPYSMSATAACAKVLGAVVRFVDIEADQFGIDPTLLGKMSPEPRPFSGMIPPDYVTKPKAIIVTNLFGHPAKLWEIAGWCKDNDVYLIEDNAQAPLAKIRIEGKDYAYTGTIGDIGVFSLNVHKHIQCGEGGVIVTNSEVFGHRLQGVINHGELSSSWSVLGLNFRMTEPTAAIACAQLSKATTLVAERREIGLELCDMVKDIPWLKAHTDQPGCRHVYYLWTALADTQDRAAQFAYRLSGRGVPIRHRYIPLLLHKLFGGIKGCDPCPVADGVDSRIVVFEVCAYDLSPTHLNTIREIIKAVAGGLDEPEGQRVSA